MERVLCVSPGYNTLYEKLPSACSPMRAIAPAPWIWCVSHASRHSPSTTARQIQYSLAPNCFLRAKLKRPPRSPLNRLPEPRTASPNRPQITTSKPQGNGSAVQRTHAPAPLDLAASHLAPTAAPQLVLPPVPPFLPPPPHQVLSSPFPSTHGSASWIPLRPASIASSSAQGPCWAPSAGVGGCTYPWQMAENIDVSDPQVWGLDSHPPGGFLSFFNNTSSHTQAVGNGTSSQPINLDDGTNGGDCKRTEKRLPWIKEEDCRLVSAWLNNSNDPIQSNYKKNEKYWKDVAAVYNSTTPKNRIRHA